MQIVKQQNKFVALSTYDERTIPKEAGFRWDPSNKQWWTDRPEVAAKLAKYADSTIQSELAQLHETRAASIEASRAADADIDIPAPEGEEYLPFQRAGIAYAIQRFGMAERGGDANPFRGNGVLIADEMG